MTEQTNQNQNPIQSLQGELEGTKDHKLKTAELVSALQREIQSLEEAKTTRERMSGEVAELQESIEKRQPQIERSKEILDAFTMMRQGFSNFRYTSMTPEEFKLNAIFQKHQEDQKLLEEKITALTEMEHFISEMPPYETLREELSTQECIFKQLEEKSRSLKKIIKQLQRIQQCLQAQQLLDDSLPEHLEFIYKFWEDDSDDYIRKYLITEGEKKNVPFSEEAVTEFIVLLDTYFFTEEDEDNANEEEMEIKPLEKFQKEILEMQVKPELVVAFANTLRLQQFPENFFSGEHGLIGTDTVVATGTRPAKITHVGVLPLDALDTLQALRQEIPDEIETILRRDNIHERFYYSFQKDTGGKNKGQLSDLCHFLQEFWRFGNFYGFTYNSPIHIHLQKQDREQVRKDYQAYLKTRRSQGLYLEV